MLVGRLFQTQRRKDRKEREIKRDEDKISRAMKPSIRSKPFLVHEDILGFIGEQ
jgi:hypothetical protein